MGRLLLVVALMVGVVAAYVHAMRGAQPLEALLATAFFGLILLLAVIGLFATLSDMRRLASLRQTRENGRSVWVWTDLRGREHRSDIDPRPKWDAEKENSGGRWGY